MEHTTLSSLINRIKSVVKSKEIKSLIGSFLQSIPFTDLFSSHMQDQLLLIVRSILSKEKLTSSLTTTLLPLLSPMYVSTPIIINILSILTKLVITLSNALEIGRIIFCISRFPVDGSSHAKVIQLLLQIQSLNITPIPPQPTSQKLLHDYVHHFLQCQHQIKRPYSFCSILYTADLPMNEKIIGCIFDTLLVFYQTTTSLPTIDIIVELIDAIITVNSLILYNTTTRQHLLLYFSTSFHSNPIIAKKSAQTFTKILYGCCEHLKSFCKECILQVINDLNSNSLNLINMASLICQEITSSPMAIHSLFTTFTINSIAINIFNNLFTSLIHAVNTTKSTSAVNSLLNIIAIITPPTEFPLREKLRVKAIEYSIQEKCPSKAPLVVANYLLKDFNLNKTNITYYLTNNPTHFSAFLSLLLNDTSFLDSLHLALSSIVFPLDFKVYSSFINAFSTTLHLNDTTSLQLLYFMLYQMEINCDLENHQQHYDYYAEVCKQNNVTPLPNDFFIPNNTTVPLPQISIDLFNTSIKHISTSLQTLHINNFDAIAPLKSLLLFSVKSNETSTKELVNILVEFITNSQIPNGDLTYFLLQFVYFYGYTLTTEWVPILSIFEMMVPIRLPKLLIIPSTYSNGYYTSNTYTLTETRKEYSNTLSCPDEQLLPRSTLNTSTPSLTLLNALLTALKANINRLFYNKHEIINIIIPFLVDTTLHPHQRVAAVAFEIQSAVMSMKAFNTDPNFCKQYYVNLYNILRDAPNEEIRHMNIEMEQKCNILRKASSDRSNEVQIFANKVLIDVIKHKEILMKKNPIILVETLRSFISQKFENSFVNDLITIAHDVIKEINQNEENDNENKMVILYCVIRSLSKSLGDNDINNTPYILHLFFVELLNEPCFDSSTRKRIISLCLKSFHIPLEHLTNTLSDVSTTVAFRALEVVKIMPEVILDVANISISMILSTSPLVQQIGLFIFHETFPILIHNNHNIEFILFDIFEYCYDQIVSSLDSFISILPSPQPLIFQHACCVNCFVSYLKSDLLKCPLCNAWVCSSQCMLKHSKTPHPFETTTIRRHLYNINHSTIQASFQMFIDILKVITSFKEDIILQLSFIHTYILRFLTLKHLPSSPIDDISKVVHLLVDVYFTLMINTTNLDDSLSLLLLIDDPDIIESFYRNYTQTTLNDELKISIQQILSTLSQTSNDNIQFNIIKLLQQIESY
ncbi:SEC7 domain-containing protein [Entamoeba marina]